MAMSLGGKGPAGEPEVMLDINTTPLIDVMLVLLVMLIITIPIQLHAVNLNLPTGNPPPPLTLPEVVKLDIDEGSRVYWNELRMPNTNALVERLKKVAVLTPQPEVQIRGDGRSNYEGVGRVVYACQRAGIAKISFITEPPPRAAAS